MSLEDDLALAFLESHPTQAAVALERLPSEQRGTVLQQVPARAAALVLREMVRPLAADSVGRLPAERAAAILDVLEFDHTTALLRRLPPEVCECILAELPLHRQEAVRRVLQYPPGSAGALMDPAVPALPDDVTIAEARLRLRRGSPSLLYYLYVLDRHQHLVGVLDIAALVRARSKDMVRSVMDVDVERLSAWTPAAAVRTHPGWRRFHALPVVDDQDRLLGAIRYQTLRRLEREAEAADAVRPAVVTATALGELFHLGMAGIVEGVSAVAAPRGRPSGPRVAEAHHD